MREVPEVDASVRYEFAGTKGVYLEPGILSDKDVEINYLLLRRFLKNLNLSLFIYR